MADRAALVIAVETFFEAGPIVPYAAADCAELMRALPAVGYAPERGNRYGYYFGTSASATCVDRATVNATIAAVKSCITADTFKFTGAVLLPAYEGNDVAFGTVGGTSPPVTSPGGVTACPGCEISAVAAANIDNDTAGIDSWFISTKDASRTGVNCSSDVAVPAGVPVNTYNDVDCP